MAASEMAVTTYVTYSYPGTFFPEHSARKVSERDPERIAREADPGVYAFRFHDVAVVMAVIDGRDVELSSPAIRKSPLYYIDAEKLTAADVEALAGDHRILLANMRCNGWGHVVRCRAGNFQPLEPGDVIVSAARAGASA